MMGLLTDREKVIKGLECCASGEGCTSDCPYFKEFPITDGRCIRASQADALGLLKAQENLKQKMWNTLYAEEDKLEKKFVGTEDDAWFFIYRPWLQRGFEIAIKVIAEQDGM